jgi:hypothetical protein
MGKLNPILLAAVLTAICAACTTDPGDTRVGARKVADQRLATYTPLRRVTYRDACGSGGPLTVSVDRVIISDHAALVEARIKNSSSQPYLLGNSSGAAALLANDTGMTLAWNGGAAAEIPGLAETRHHFRMDGHFSGEPASFLVHARRKNQGEADGTILLAVGLGADSR